MERFIQSFKDPQKSSLAIAALFFVGIALSIYFLFTLPHDLEFKGGMTSSGLATAVYAKVFIVLAITFALGVVAINALQRIKKEIIVFKEKSIDSANEKSEQDAAAITLDKQTFLTSLTSAKAGEVAKVGLNSICDLLHAGQGALYKATTSNSKRMVEMKASFALLGESEKITFEFGEGLVGQAAASGKSIYLDELPEGYSNAIVSGLGSAAPKFLYVAPIKKENNVLGVIEIATFTPIGENTRKQAEELAVILIEKM